MALPPLSLNSRTSSASSVCTCPLSPSFYNLLIQPQNHSLSNPRNLVRFRISCSEQTVQVDTLQSRRTRLVSSETGNTKRKPRPSFFEQIREKWSLKLGSTRKKFPWEEPEQREKLEQKEQEENRDFSGASVSESEVDDKESVSEPASFVLSNVFVPAPWVHRSNTKNFRIDSEPEAPQKRREKKGASDGSGGPLRNGVVKGVAERDESVEIRQQEVVRNGECEREGDMFAEIPIGVKKGKETKVWIGRNAVSSKEKPSGEAGNFEKNVASVDGNSGSIRLPWKREECGMRRRSNTELAERTLPEHELRRLRNVALRMLERTTVGVAGITQALVDSMHEKWKSHEVVKLKFEGPLAVDMKRTHEILEAKTGGLVIWRSGSSVVLYRGIAYKLPCVQSYTKQSQTNITMLEDSKVAGSDTTHNMGVDTYRARKPFIPDSAKYLKDLSEDELMEFSDLDHLLDDLGPRFTDWTGREPLPVDADLLPAVVSGYRPPFRLLPYGLRHCLRNKEMTFIRRLARTMPPHFALGRSRELQGLARAMAKLWERSAIAKIAIKRGVLNTRNERMAEELKKLTGGTLVSRNKEYIVFYRGNDFLPPSVTEALKERRKLADLQQDEEDHARQRALALIESKAKASKGPLVAGTLAETMAATSRWGNQPTGEDVQKMIRDSALTRHALLVRYLQSKLALAKWKLKKAEKALAKVQEYLEPADLPTDLETITDEERFLFRKMGLSMKPFLLLGRRGVYDGTIQNMHLHWKYRELVKIIVRGKRFEQVKHIAISLEAESGGVLVSLDKTTKGYAIIVYRGKNYLQPQGLKPKNLLTRRQALARSIELQRSEALKHHISDLHERIELVKSELEDLSNGKDIDASKTLYSRLDDPNVSDDDMEEDKGEEAYLEIYDGGREDINDQNM
ncbi:hypothetical protein F2P56_022828 [Juglans regia]|uniref:CRM domain-containing protein n=2 Tax=Juglans regia TaxID=51240 RepID=A0A833X428_JUGRE|nr:CRM-domain containing factor CFM3, chloroplastic/mitochondrial [Juglans regia]KAF5458827.1 hypothetical protein F2P56_022828 [Juglans regia]